MTDDDLEILERETAYEGFFRIDRYRLRHRLFSGDWSPPMSREVFERGRAVGLLLYDPQRDALVLVEQFRLPAHLAGFPAWQTEIVAGILDHPGESPVEVARREAEEEAGMTIIGEPIAIQRYMPSPGGSTETVDLFCAHIDATGAGGIHGLADEHEDIRVVVRSWRGALRMLRAGEIQNGITIIALYWLALNRTKLRRLWR